MIVHAASATGEQLGGNVITIGAALRCDCGSDDLFAFRPGAEPLRGASGRVLVRRGDAIRCWCLPCWQASLR